MPKTETGTKFGRLKSLGITSLTELALNLPVSVNDNTQVVESFDTANIVANRPIVVRGRLNCDPETVFSGGTPRTQFTVHDGLWWCRFSLFGDTRSLTKKYKKNAPIAVRGTTKFFSGKLYINDAEIIEPDELGTIVAVYKGKAGAITPATARKLIRQHLNTAIPKAEAYLLLLIKQSISDPVAIAKIFDIPDEGIASVLTQAHNPTSLEQWQRAIKTLTRISAYLAGKALLTYRKPVTVPAIQGRSYKELVQHVPFPLTDEQNRCVGQMVKTVRSGQLLEGLLVGDVGTGKTIVYGLLVAYFASAGQRVAVLLPNETLARQIHTELSSAFPWMAPSLITGSDENGKTTASVLIGTTALLFRDVGTFGLVVVDEQQKMSTEQREQLRHDQTHLLEVSATPIPRTMALALYGSIDIFQLTKCHVEKNIDTKVWEKDERKAMFMAVMDTVQRGKKVLVVCPKREGKDNTNQGLRSVEDMAQRLESYLPGQVTASHSGLSSEENQNAIDDIKTGRKKVFVATTVVEVGITIPELERVVIVHPERFGLQQLHQIRGRVARQGGLGYCDLYLPHPLKNPDSYARLKIMEKTQDGFEIAEEDLALRGMGDVRRDSGQQHGDTDIDIKNIRITLKQVHWMVAAINHHHQNHHQLQGN